MLATISGVGSSHLVKSPLRFLFDPVEVSKRVSPLVHLNSALGDPHQEGEVSVGFPGARRSRREIYRVLANLQYPHLDQLVQSLESCLAHGYEQPTVLRTSVRKPFVEALAELQAAEHFLLRGFRVRGLDTSKQSDRVPDLVICGGRFELAVEVYCPRQWEGLDDLTDDLKDAVMNLDAPFNYEAELQLRLDHEFDAHGRLLQPHPGEMASLLTPDIRGVIVAAVISEMERKLGGAKGSFAFDQRRPDLNLAISVTVGFVNPTNHHLPVRQFSCSGPSITGHAPEWIFQQIAVRAGRKASRRQATGFAPLSLLLVDLSRSQITSELEHSDYRKRFVRCVDGALPNGAHPYDVIAFHSTPAWGCEIRVIHLLRGRKAPMDLVPQLFDQVGSVSSR